MGKLSQEEIKAAFEASGIESEIRSMGSQEVLIGKLTKRDWLIVGQKESIPSELFARLEHNHNGINATWQQIDGVSLPSIIRCAQELVGKKIEVNLEVKPDARSSIRLDQRTNGFSKSWVVVITFALALATSYGLIILVNQCRIQPPASNPQSPDLPN